MKNCKTATKEKAIFSLHPKVSELIDTLAAAELQSRSAYITALVLREAREKGIYNDFDDEDNNY